MHDYWLLAGIAKHGYSRWGDIAADPQFSLVQQPFLAMDKKRDNVLDMQKGFLQRRFKLLESALIEEEQLRRAQIEKMNTIDNEEWLSMQRNFNELDAIAQAHAYLTNPEILKENKIGTFVLQKTLLKMEELLNALKQDLAKLPMVISGWGQVQDRLQMNERYTVAHLLTASANLTENDGTQPESAESRDQREQFKQLAKNTHVAKALRFCNETGSFFIGKGVKLDSFEMPNGDIVEVPASESNGEEGKDACESEENNETKEKVTKNEIDEEDTMNDNKEEVTSEQDQHQQENQLEKSETESKIPENPDENNDKNSAKKEDSKPDNESSDNKIEDNKNNASEMSDENTVEEQATATEQDTAETKTEEQEIDEAGDGATQNTDMAD